MLRGACYLRSSKDRHDISLDAQRRELRALAQSKQIAIVEEFSDAVESGKDENRPAFQALLKRMKDRERAWTVLLALDTSRIARNQYLAHALHFECEKQGIRILYAKIPETNTITDVVIRAVFQAFDQLHSLMSREKGLAGMAENVRQGYRAGGRAPMGYRLDRIATGAFRDGAPVTKSRLVPSPDAARVGAYLKARADGASRRQAAADHGLRLSAASLIGLEWNALTYAGHTVWNVNAERLSGGGYKGGTKRRPRAEWVIQYDTHPRLIGTEEAESILTELESGRRPRHRTSGAYLLSGILVAPDGTAWHGDGDGSYRIRKGKRVSQSALEAAVVEKMIADMTSKPFIAALAREARTMSEPPSTSDLKALRGDLAAHTARINKLMVLAGQCETPRPFLEQIATVEKAREKIAAELHQKELDAESAALLRAVSERDVERMLADLAGHLAAVDRDALKELISGLVERIELDPTEHVCRVHYRIPTGDLLASPRGSQEIPALRAVRSLVAPFRRSG